MNYLGIDLSKRDFHAVVMDQQGAILHSHKYQNTREDVLAVLARCGEKPSAVIEATQNWMWLVNLLKQQKIEVTLAHPLKTKAIASARIKNDELDATTLAHLLRSNLVPGSYIATIEEQENRELSRARCQLVKQQTWCKNQVHSLLTKENLIPSVSDLFGTKGRFWLESIAGQLPPAKQLVLNQWLTLLADTQARVKDLEAAIHERCRGDHRVELLQTIPGFGEITAFVIVSEVGDVARFPTGKQFASYLGLVPSLYQSGKTKRLGSITKLGNPYARWILVQTAHRLVRGDATYKLAYAALALRRGKKKAIVAIARKLAVLSWRLLVDQRPYQAQAPNTG